MDFQIGDRVRANQTIITSHGSIKEGMGGVVVGFGAVLGNPGVQFDRYVGGHTCDGACPDGFGWFVERQRIELVCEQDVEDIEEGELAGLLLNL